MAGSTLRIVLIHQAFVAPSEAGGTRHFEFAQHLRRAGHEVTIVASDLSYLTGKKLSTTPRLVTEETIDGVRVLRAYTFSCLHRSFTWRILSFISFMCTSLYAAFKAGPVDIVIGTTPPIFQALSTWLFARCRHKLFLLEVRDLWPAFAVDMGVLKSRTLIRAAEWLERFLYLRASHFLVNSPAYRDYLIERGIPSEKIAFIPNGADPELFQPDSRGERARRELGLEDKFVVTYAGALGLANDIPTLLRAAERLRDHSDIHFVLLGDGKERQVLEGAARTMKLHNVSFAGVRAKAKVAEFLAASDACVAILKDIPMFRTTYPNKVFDYMAAGRPTILCIGGVIRKVIESAQAGLFIPPGRDDALAEAVLYLKSSPSDAAKMGRSARAYVVEHFNRRDQAVDFKNLLERLLEGSACRSGSKLVRQSNSP